MVCENPEPIADGHFEYDENGRKFSKGVENTGVGVGVGGGVWWKGEIACY